LRFYAVPASARNGKCAGIIVNIAGDYCSGNTLKMAKSLFEIQEVAQTFIFLQRHLIKPRLFLDVRGMLA